MHTYISVPVINHDCPKGMTPTNCPLRDWLNNDQSLFGVINSEKDSFCLTPTQALFLLARRNYTQALEHMNQICRGCQESQK